MANRNVLAYGVDKPTKKILVPSDHEITYMYRQNANGPPTSNRTTMNRINKVFHKLIKYFRGKVRLAYSDLVGGHAAMGRLGWALTSCRPPGLRGFCWLLVLGVRVVVDGGLDLEFACIGDTCSSLGDGAGYGGHSGHGGMAGLSEANEWARPVILHRLGSGRPRSHLNTQALCKAQVEASGGWAPTALRVWKDLGAAMAVRSGNSAADETERLFQALSVESSCSVKTQGRCSGGPQRPRGWASTWQIPEDASLFLLRFLMSMGPKMLLSLEGIRATTSLLSLLGVSRGPRSRVSALHRSPSVPVQASQKLLYSGLLLKLCDLDLDMTLDGHLPLAIGRSSCLDLLFFRFADAHARESLYDLREQAGEVKQGSQLFLQESLACLMLKISALLDNPLGTLSKKSEYSVGPWSYEDAQAFSGP